MRRQELQPKRELLALVQQLNDCVSVSARRMYTQHVTPMEMLQRPFSDTRCLLPELCLFVNTLLPLPFPIKNNTSFVAPPSTRVRDAFRHPEAQWLSPSARESGISALLCQQLVRLARQDSASDMQDHKSTWYWSPVELILRVLLDALLSSCVQRLGQAPDACRWQPLQLKPRFHSMTCFPVWSSLLPFVALIGIDFPDVFQQMLKEHRRTERTSDRVNCDFALVRGIWRLVDELDRHDKKKQRAVTDVMASLLRFASDRMLLCCKSGKDDKKPVDSHLDDQLLEKFFTGMQTFLFKSWRADEILKQTLFGTLEEALSHTACGAKTGAVPQRVVVFTIAGCMLVKDLAVDIVSMVMKQINDPDTLSGKARHPLLPFLVGFCAHVDLVRLTSVLKVLKMLVASYKAVAHNVVDLENQRQRQRELVFYIVYVTLLRSESVESLRQEVSSDAAAILEILKQFQMQLCSEIAYEDFQVAAPVHWMARVWKHWVFLSDEDVQSFMFEAQKNNMDPEQEFKKRVTAWQGLEALIAFKLPSFSWFPQMKTLVEPHLISLPLADLNDENGLVVRGRKRRRAEKMSATYMNSEQLERSFDVLLLPDVMERVCSFMSAKRLCRMTLVCRAFAELSHQASLWRQLYLRIGCSIGRKQSVLLASPVECCHGDSYKHNWRRMYKERWTVLQRLRRMQRRTIEAGQSSGEASSTNNYIATFIPQMCTYCGCNQVLKSASEQNAHEAQHKRFTCTEFSCQASFISLHKFHQHRKEHATKNTVDLATTCRLVCGYNGCKKSYLSAKRMTTHRQKAHH